ncbi:MAG: hypothetical protein ACQSGP_03050 [Frankia sp.]
MNPIQHTENLETSFSPAEVIERSRSALEKRGARLNATRSGLEASGGSRLALRIWGVYLKRGRSRLPWRATIDVHPSPSGQSRVSISARSGEGLMVVRVPRLTTAYDQMLVAIVSAVRLAIEE